MNRISSIYLKSLITLVLLLLYNNINAQPKYQMLNASNGLLDNSAQQIINLKDGRMIITTLGNINFYDGANFYYIHSRYNNDFYLKDYKGHYHIYIDNEDYLWLKDKHKVYCVNLLTEKYENVKEVLTKKFGNKNYTDLFGTMNGSLWLVENSSTLYGVDERFKLKIPREAGNLQDLDVYDGKLMLFFGNGMLYVYRQKDGKLLNKSCPYGVAEQKEYESTSFAKYHNGKYYQLRNGKKKSILQVYDIKTNKWTTLLKVPYHLNNMAFKDDNTLYIACEYGYYIYKIDSNTLSQECDIYTDDGKIVATDINTICFDNQGGTWFGTEKRGVLYGKPVDTPFTLLDWSDPRCIAIYKLIDKHKVQTKFNNRSYHCVIYSNGLTWVGTDDGLAIYKNNVHIRTYNTKDGLPNNVVHSIVADRKGNLWLSTSYGIACVIYNSKTKSYDIHNFTKRDGTGYELYENGKSILLPNGNIAMQSIDNITVFDPQVAIDNISDVNNAKYRLTPVIVNIFTMGARIEVGKQYNDNVILNKASSKTDSVELNYNQNNITFIVSSMNYYRPNETYFRYRLLGSDDNKWKVISTYSFEGRSAKDGEVSLNFSNLSPGTYKLEIQASMFKDVWDGGTKTLTLSVNQPWWRKTGLQFAFSFMILVILGIDLVYYSRMIKLKTQLKYTDDGIILRLSNYIKNCNKLSGSVLSPNPSTALSGENDELRELITSQDVVFIRKIIPAISKHKTGEYTMRQLCNDTGFKRDDVYKYSKRILTTQLRVMTLILHLNNAAKLLIETNQTVESISDITRFVNVEYFRYCFLREFKCSPEEYRRKHQ